MATFSTIPSANNGLQKTMLITDVSAGDRIDCQAILGRTARGLQLHVGATTDDVSYRLNSLLRLNKHTEDFVDETILMWAVSPEFPVYSSTGALSHTMIDAIQISSIEITALTLASGTTIEIIIW